MNALTGWWPARRLAALVAFLVASVTALAAVELGASRGGVEGWLLLVGLAAFVPAGVAFQVVAGQALIASLLLGGPGPSPLALASLVGGVIATSELLATVARLDAPAPRGLGDAFSRAARSAVLGAAAFTVVALAAGLPGPKGLFAVLLAASACGFLAFRLVRERV